MPRFAEFFSGGGMARLGLGERWTCVLANDLCASKCATYRENFGSDHLVEGDIAHLDPARLRQPIDLYWASSPCQDFSLAGKGAGLAGRRSGIFETWVDIIAAAAGTGYRPRIIAFENVVGLLARSEGRDFIEVLSRFVSLGYRVGARVLDARHWLPQSRPRLFVIALRSDIDLPIGWGGPIAGCLAENARLEDVLARAPLALRSSLFRLPAPQQLKHTVALADLVEHDVLDASWLSADQLAFLRSIMSDLAQRKLDQAIHSRETVVGTLYKRGRPDSLGKVAQRAEVRFDGIAGCLRTPAGGSSRQTLVFAGKGRFAARLMTARESARLMGLPDTYILPPNLNRALHLTGDGVAVPVVSWLRDHVFEPILAADSALAHAA
jgi:DNA (cytosine-5)-methyltransferase 1